MGFLDTFFGLFTTTYTPPPLNLSSFHEVVTIEDDTWGNYKDGQICLSYYEKEEDVPTVDPSPYSRIGDMIKYSGVAYIDYRKYSGQVGLIRVNEDMRGRGIGKQMVQKAMEDMRSAGTKEIWAVTSKNHEFWSNVFNKSFTWREPAGRGVTGSGYFMKLDTEGVYARGDVFDSIANDEALCGIIY